MIRVAFISDGRGSDWLGGSNYIVNLLSAIMLLEDRTIEPVLFVAPDTEQGFLDSLPPIEIVRTRWVDHDYLPNKFRKLFRNLIGQDYLFEHFLGKHKIHAISHSRSIGRRHSVPVISWIPDFQYKHYPDFFPLAEIKKRTDLDNFVCAHSDAVILSSQHARSDLARFHPNAVSRSFVLNFASSLQKVDLLDINFQSFVSKYSLDNGYFFLPNQFWAHKNHRVVIEALRISKDAGYDLTVVCTGSTKDKRNPDYFESLISYAISLGVEKSLQVLGIVPYETLLALMRGSIAVLNPSLFEGWSTSVEEAKSMGKAVILSNIDVHIEQNPSRGYYFAPNDPAVLSNLMIDLVGKSSSIDESAEVERALSKMDDRLRDFARTYQEIVTTSVALF